MLVQYAVKNFKSIKDEIVINYRVDEKYCDSKWVIENEEIPVYLYKCIGLIGPNASGKSNIIESMYYAFRFILNTIKRRDTSKIAVERFAFGDVDNENPTALEFIFYQNGIKYIYGFSINDREVLEEYLMGYFSAEPETVFDRGAGKHFEFMGNDVKTQEEIAEKTNANRLYLPVAAEWGYAPLKKVYDWFVFHFRQYLDFSISRLLSEIIKNKGQKEILIQELHKADFNIKDIYVKNRKMDQKSHDFIEKLFAELIGESEDFQLSDSNPVIKVVHENGNGDMFEIELDEDSSGTESFVENLAEFLYLSEQGGFMLEDELGKTYHMKLVQHFFKMFQSNFVNKGNTQLLFTTHNTKILKMVNPDQIYLVDKDEMGATIVKLLDDYDIGEDDDIELGYLNGRFGSVPYMKG